MHDNFSKPNLKPGVFSLSNNINSKTKKLNNSSFSSKRQINENYIFYQPSNCFSERQDESKEKHFLLKKQLLKKQKDSLNIEKKAAVTQRSYSLDTSKNIKIGKIIENPKKNEGFEYEKSSSPSKLIQIVANSDYLTKELNEVKATLKINLNKIEKEKQLNIMKEAEINSLQANLQNERLKYQKSLLRFSDKIKKLKNIQQLYVTEKQNSEKLETQLIQKESLLSDHIRKIEEIVSLIVNFSIFSKTQKEFLDIKTTNNNIQSLIINYENLLEKVISIAKPAVINANLTKDLQTINQNKLKNLLYENFQEKSKNLNKEQRNKNYFGKQSKLLERKRKNIKPLKNSQNNSFTDILNPGVPSKPLLKNQSNNYFSKNTERNNLKNLLNSMEKNQIEETNKRTSPEIKNSNNNGSFTQSDIGLHTPNREISYDTFKSDLEAAGFDEDISPGSKIIFEESPLHTQISKDKIKLNGENKENISDNHNETNNNIKKIFVEENAVLKDKKINENILKDEMYAIVKFDYTPQKDNDLALKIGEKVQILNKTNNGWWIGMMKNKIGYFPYNYVE